MGRVALKERLLPGDPSRRLGAFYRSHAAAKQSWLPPYLPSTQEPWPSHLPSSAQPHNPQLPAGTALWVLAEIPTQVVWEKEVTTVPPHRALH